MYIQIYLYIIKKYICIYKFTVNDIVRLTPPWSGDSQDQETFLYIYIRRFACQQRVLKTFPGPGYLHSEDGVSLTM